jgi:DNA-binding NarL/FixJ family response regulator
MDKIKIFIADNQTLTRIGIITFVSEYYNSHVEIEQFETKENLFKSLRTIQPHILIIDFELFDFDSICELSEIKKISPNTGVLIVSDNQLPDDILQVLNCGISNYISKNSNKQELIDAVNVTIENRKYFSSEILDILLDQKASKSKIYSDNNKHITSAEQGIIKLIAQGLTNNEIAHTKNLSYHTIISHRKNIFRKLGINNCSELIMYAMRSGILEATEYSI